MSEDQTLEPSNESSESESSPVGDETLSPATEPVESHEAAGGDTTPVTGAVTLDPGESESPSQPEDQPAEDDDESEGEDQPAEDDDESEGFEVPIQPGMRGQTFVRGTRDAYHNISATGRSATHPSER